MGGTLIYEGAIYIYCVGLKIRDLGSSPIWSFWDGIHCNKHRRLKLKYTFEKVDVLADSF